MSPRPVDPGPVPTNGTLVGTRPTDVPFVGSRTVEIGVPDADDLLRVVRTALAEDLRYGPDATTAATVAADTVAVGAFSPRAGGVLARARWCSAGGR